MVPCTVHTTHTACVPETCGAKNMSIKLPICFKLAFHFISWGRCTFKKHLKFIAVFTSPHQWATSSGSLINSNPPSHTHTHTHTSMSVKRGSSGKILLIKFVFLFLIFPVCALWASPPKNIYFIAIKVLAGPNREEVIRSWKKLHSEELYNL